MNSSRFTVLICSYLEAQHVQRTGLVILHFFGPMLIAFGCCLLIPLFTVILCSELQQGYRTCLGFLAPAGSCFVWV